MWGTQAISRCWTLASRGRKAVDRLVWDLVSQKLQLEQTLMKAVVKMSVMIRMGTPTTQ